MFCSETIETLICNEINDGNIGGVANELENFDFFIVQRNLACKNG
jgi:hypothetical protein